MTSLTALLVLVLISAAAVAAGIAVAAVVRNDGRIGLGQRPAPPRSHPADLFEPRLPV